MSIHAAPINQRNRILVLDSLRGIAILGILLMNIKSMAFAVIGNDPSIMNEYGTINYYIWYFVTWMADGTQRALFSMLFGAGILLFLSGKEKSNDNILPLDYLFRRQLWLIFFGLVNIYLFLWRGDILFDYGCYGFLILAFRLWEPKKLLWAAGVCMLLMLARENRDLYLEKNVISKGEAIEQLDTSITKLTSIQKEQLGAMQDIREWDTHESKLKRIDRANRLMTGSYADLYEYRTKAYLDSMLEYTYFSIWEVLEFMFLGMAFFKMGILSGEKSIKFYALIAFVGLVLGALVSYWQLQARIETGFNSYQLLKSRNFSFYEAGRALRSIGVFGFLMLLYKLPWFDWFFKLMQPVGQMAFTNYLTQSIIGAIIFYGIGFSYFGQLPRYQVYSIVLAIWTTQVIWSHVWLRYFQYGPFEWIWRQLTYWKKLPIGKKKL